MRTLLAYSGGLDTSYLTARLAAEGHDLVCVTVDCGGFSAQDHEALRERALRFGALEHLCVDARAPLFDRVLRHLIAANVRRGGTYPISVAAERGLQAETLAQVARERGFDAVAHGSTGAGNDQVRFEAALAVVAEDLTVLAPVRDLGPRRPGEPEAGQTHGGDRAPAAAPGAAPRAATGSAAARSSATCPPKRGSSSRRGTCS